MNAPAFYFAPAVGYLAVGAAPPGFATIFKGWNVWDIWQAQDPVEGLGDSISNLGLSLERQLRIFVEKWADNGPGVAVGDTANPFALRGDQVDIIPNAADLQPAETRSQIPELAGAVQVGKEGTSAQRFTVKFFNRGAEAVVAWPHDANYLAENVYQPTATSPITGAPPPSSLAGAASAAAGEAAQVLKVVAIGAGVLVGIGLIVALVNSGKKAGATA